MKAIDCLCDNLITTQYTKDIPMKATTISNHITNFLLFKMLLVFSLFAHANSPETLAPTIKLSSPGFLDRGVSLKDENYPYTDYIPMSVIDFLGDEKATEFAFTKNVNINGSTTNNAGIVFKDLYKRKGLLPTVYYKEFYNPFHKHPRAFQYWLYYYNNNWLSDHISDWETITIFLDEDYTPQEATYSTHYEAIKHSWDKISASGRAEINVSNGGHGSYALPGRTRFAEYTYVGPDLVATTVRGATDDHMGNRERIDNYNLINLDNAQSVIFPGEYLAKKWTSHKGEWGRTVGIGIFPFNPGPAPVGPLWRTDKSQYFFNSLGVKIKKNRVNPKDPYRNCNEKEKTRIYGEQSTLDLESLKGLTGYDEIHAKMDEVVFHGPWLWSLGYGLDDENCKPIPEIQVPEIESVELVGSSIEIKWKDISPESSLGYSVIVTDKPNVSTDRSIINSEVLPSSEVCNEYGECNRTITYDGTGNEFCIQIIAFNPDKKVQSENSCPSNISFVIDDTGSMQEEIDGIKNTLKEFALENSSDGHKFQLVTFKDEVTIRSFNTDADDIITGLDGLYAYGGDDCPESSLQALYQTIEGTKKNGVVFIATDASSKPGGSITVSKVKDLAEKKNITVNVLLSGNCSSTAYRGLVNTQDGNYSHRNTTANRSASFNDLEGSISASGRPVTTNFALDAYIGGYEDSDSSTLDEVDYFILTMLADKSYAVDVNWKEGYSNISFQLLNEEEEILSSITLNSQYTADRFNIKTTADGNYYLKVEAGYKYAASKYTVAVLEEELVDKGFEQEAFEEISKATGGKFLFDETINQGDSAALEDFVGSILVEAVAEVEPIVEVEPTIDEAPTQIVTTPDTSSGGGGSTNLFMLLLLLTLSGIAFKLPRNSKYI